MMYQTTGTHSHSLIHKFCEMESQLENRICGSSTPIYLILIIGAYRIILRNFESEWDKHNACAQGRVSDLSHYI